MADVWLRRLPARVSKTSCPRGAQAEEFGHLHGRAKACFQLTLHGAQVLPKDLLPPAALKLAGFQIEENLELPGAESVPPGGAAGKLSDEAPEPV